MKTEANAVEVVAESGQGGKWESEPKWERNVIPPITDPMGRHWKQPATLEILIDDTHALMTKETFKALGEYSGTFPSGVYPGKMWKRHDGLFDPRCKPEDRVWMLIWFGYATDGHPDYVSNNFRKVLLV